MSQQDQIERFNELSSEYEELLGPGATLKLKNELNLGEGPFNEILTEEDLKALVEELADRLENA